MRGGRGFPSQLYESTAADRAAADMQRGGRILKEAPTSLAAAASLSHALYGIINQKAYKFFPPAGWLCGLVSRRDLTQAYRRLAQRTGGTKPKKYPVKRQPLFGREAVRGERRFSQRSGLSPQFSPPPRLLGGEREGGGFSSEKPPPSHTCIVLLRFVPVFALVNLGGEGDI